jgi:peptidoglycan/LPS O-acetylase OafA/YrhL
VDAARGLAAGIVFFHHLTVFFPAAFRALVGNATFAARAVEWISERNAAAVMLFFIVSGFCIRFSSYKLDFSRPQDRLDYARRRLARILPLYWFSLLFAGSSVIIQGQTADPSFSLRNLLGNLAFLQNAAAARGTWFVPYALNGPLWSLSYEAFFYLMFPTMTLLERQIGIDRTHTKLALAFCVSALSFVFYQLVPNPIMLFISYYCVWRIGASAFETTTRREDALSSLIFVCIVFVVLCILNARFPSGTLTTIINGIIIGALWLTIQLLPQVGSSSGVKPLANVILLLARLGSISYALYLLHYPITELTSKLLGDSVFALSIATVSAVIMAAMAETAALRIKDSILNVRTAREA